MNEEQKSAVRKWLPVILTGLALALLYFFWPEDRGRAFRRAVFDGNLSKVQRWAKEWPELVNATNSRPPKVQAVTQTHGQPLGSMDRLVVDIFEGVTRVRIKNRANTPDPFQGAENAGLPPLQMALIQKNPEMARILVDMGADVKAVSASGMTALHYATLGDHGSEILGLLLAKGAVADATNVQSLTPLYFSVLRGNEQNVRLLLRAGANPNATTRDGGNVLHVAAGRPDTRIIPLLLKQGANAAHTNLNGQTALDVARQRKVTQAIQLLSTAALGGNTP